MSLSSLRRGLIASGLLFVLGAAAFVALVGPWPTYADSNYTDSIYYRDALREIDNAIPSSGLQRRSGDLRAGWASREITPPIGTPMAGFSAREDGKRSTGVRDPLFVRAVAFSDGIDAAMIIVVDMLVIPPVIAKALRDHLAADPGLPAGAILFNATHTHCGPGAFAPDVGARITGGAYDPSVESLLIKKMTEAAREAHGSMAPVGMASGSRQLPQFIKNRARDDGPVDAELGFLSLRGDDGRHALIVTYAAHPTVFGRRTTEFSRDYPGALQDFLHEKTGADVIFLSGAVGSMGPDRPDADTRDESVEKMGRGLAWPVLASLQKLQHTDEVDIASFGFQMGMPPIQVRPIHPQFRLSPWIAHRIGIERQGWVQFLRINDLLLVGLPFDFSGETSLDWKAWADERGIELWPTSFSGDYCGYQSPDRYYLDEPLDYETGQMNWFGPNLEAYLTDVFQHAVERMEESDQAGDKAGPIESATADDVP